MNPVTLVLMGGIFVLIYFLMIRPQRKKMQTHQQLLNELQVGDDILTSSGIYGRISSFDGDSLFIEVSDSNFLKITRASIAQKIVYEAPSENNAPEAVPEKTDEPDEAKETTEE